MFVINHPRNEWSPRVDQEIEAPESFISYLVAWAVGETLTDDQFWNDLREEEMWTIPQ